jgi:hypothetical protein
MQKFSQGNKPPISPLNSTSARSTRSTSRTCVLQMSGKSQSGGEQKLMEHLPWMLPLTDEPMPDKTICTALSLYWDSRANTYTGVPSLDKVTTDTLNREAKRGVILRMSGNMENSVRGFRFKRPVPPGEADGGGGGGGGGGAAEASPAKRPKVFREAPTTPPAPPARPRAAPRAPKKKRVSFDEGRDQIVDLNEDEGDDGKAPHAPGGPTDVVGVAAAAAAAPAEPPSPKVGSNLCADCLKPITMTQSIRGRLPCGHSVHKSCGSALAVMVCAVCAVAGRDE